MLLPIFNMNNGSKQEQNQFKEQKQIAEYTTKCNKTFLKSFFKYADFNGDKKCFYLYFVNLVTEVIINNLIYSL